MKRRTLIQWDPIRDRELLVDLEPFRARARGKRIRALATLGMLVKLSGYRAVQRDGEWTLEWLPVAGAAADPLPAPPALASPPVEAMTDPTQGGAFESPQPAPVSCATYEDG